MAEYTPVERDDIRHALSSLLDFYDKELDERQWRFWWTVLKKFPADTVKRAFTQYLEEGKYAPKPASIAEIAKRYVDNSPAHKPAPLSQVKRANPETEKAWTWYLAWRTKDWEWPMWQSALKGVTPELEERYLHLVNHAAKDAGLPDAIEPEHRLKEVWG